MLSGYHLPLRSPHPNGHTSASAHHPWVVNCGVCRVVIGRPFSGLPLPAHHIINPSPYRSSHASPASLLPFEQLFLLGLMVNTYKYIYIAPQYEHAMTSSGLAPPLSSRKTQKYAMRATTQKGEVSQESRGRIVFIPTLTTGTIIVHVSSIKAINQIRETRYRNSVRAMGCTCEGRVLQGPRSTTRWRWCRGEMYRGGEQPGKGITVD